jgi:hypothetical protein
MSSVLEKRARIQIDGTFVSAQSVQEMVLDLGIDL